jgi:hypothetical protein
MPKKEDDTLSREWFRKQGAAGGKKRAENLTPERRKAIARKAAAARWPKKK